MTAPAMIQIALTAEERGLVFGSGRKLRGGAGNAIIKARQRIDPITGRGEMLPQCLGELRAVLKQFAKHTGTYQNITRALIAAAERNLQVIE